MPFILVATLQIRHTVFYDICKQREESYKYDAKPSSFEELGFVEKERSVKSIFIKTTFLIKTIYP